MYKVEITETCLKDGYNQRFDMFCADMAGVNSYLHAFCYARGLDVEKIHSRFRMIERGTAKGVKLFYTPEPGIRMYVWINIYEEKRLV